MYSADRISKFAGMLESYLIPREYWHIVPRRIIAEVTLDDGDSEVIAHHPDYGWFVLATGQGPFVAWTDMGESMFERVVADYWLGRNKP